MGPKGKAPPATVDHCLVPKDQRGPRENVHNDLEVGDRIKFSFPELDMKCNNGEITSLKKVSAPATLRCSFAHDHLFQRALKQVHDKRKYDKNGHPRYWVTFKAKGRFARNYIASDDDFTRIAKADQVTQEPRSTLASAHVRHRTSSSDIKFCCDVQAEDIGSASSSAAAETQ